MQKFLKPSKRTQKTTHKPSQQNTCQNQETGLEEAGETGKEDTYQDFDTLEALKILEPREKAVIVLRFFEDQKLEDIARTLQENTNTVKTILYRSLKKLRVELTEGELLYEG